MASWLYSRRLGRTLLVWCVALWLVPSLLVYGERALGVPALGVPAHVLLGIVVLLAGTVIYLAVSFGMSIYDGDTALPLDTDNQLIISGAYAHVRNPLIAAALVQALGVALIFDSIVALDYSFVGAIFWYVAVRPGEERRLVERFGERYLRYRRSVPLWLPRVTAYTEEVG